MPMSMGPIPRPPQPPKVSPVQRMFQRLDANHDAVVTREELDQRGDVKFERFDLNGDKVVTVEEIQQARGTCGPRGKMPAAAPMPTGPSDTGQ